MGLGAGLLGLERTPARLASWLLATRALRLPLGAASLGATRRPLDARTRPLESRLIPSRGRAIPTERRTNDASSVLFVNAEFAERSAHGAALATPPCPRAGRFAPRRFPGGRTLRSNGLARGCRSRRRAAFLRSRFGLLRQRAPRRGAAAFALQNTFDRARARRRNLLPRVFAARRVPRGLLAGRRGLSFAGRRQANAGAARLRQPNRDRLLGIACAVLTFAHMMHLFANEFAGLRGGRFSFALVLTRGLHCLFLGHVSLLEESDCTVHRKMRADRASQRATQKEARQMLRMPVRRATEQAICATSQREAGTASQK